MEDTREEQEKLIPKEVEPVVAEIKREALGKFNNGDFEGAMASFESLLATLQSYLTVAEGMPEHPEVVKAQKSIKLAEKKLVADLDSLPVAFLSGLADKRKPKRASNGAAEPIPAIPPPPPAAAKEAADAPPDQTVVTETMVPPAAPEEAQGNQAAEDSSEDEEPLIDLGAVQQRELREEIEAAKAEQATRRACH